MTTNWAKRLAILLPALTLLALALPTAASAQATRTWVSGVGDDVNPCSRTAPCKTFAGAISKTAAGGEINAIDSGGFGAVTITKSITIDGHGYMASILGASTNGIVINTSTDTAKVTIRNLRINGVRGTFSPGINGIRIIKAGTVRIEKVTIFGFGTTGIRAENNLTSKLTVADCSIHDNGAGIVVKPPSATGVIVASIRRTDLDDNGNGVVADSTLGGTAFVTVRSSAITNSGGFPVADGFAIHSTGVKSTLQIVGNEIQGNRVGIRIQNSGKVLTGGDNDFFGNSAPGEDPTGTIGKK